MTSSEFVANLSGMMDGQDFPREQLKVGFFWGGSHLEKRGGSLQTPPDPPQPLFPPRPGSLQLHPQPEAGVGTVSRGSGGGYGMGGLWYGVGGPPLMLSTP